MLEHFYQIWAKIFGKAVLGTPCLGLFGVYGHVNVNRLLAEQTFYHTTAETKLLNCTHHSPLPEHWAFACM